MLPCRQAASIRMPKIQAAKRSLTRWAPMRRRSTSYRLQANLQGAKAKSWGRKNRRVLIEYESHMII
jgi:hypothetical protein